MLLKCSNASIVGVLPSSTYLGRSNAVSSHHARIWTIVM
jgi:hypothetical protein